MNTISKHDSISINRPVTNPNCLLTVELMKMLNLCLLKLHSVICGSYSVLTDHINVSFQAQRPVMERNSWTEMDGNVNLIVALNVHINHMKSIRSFHWLSRLSTLTLTVGQM